MERDRAARREFANLICVRVGRGFDFTPKTRGTRKICNRVQISQKGMALVYFENDVGYREISGSKTFIRWC